MSLPATRSTLLGAAALVTLGLVGGGSPHQNVRVVTTIEFHLR